MPPHPCAAITSGTLVPAAACGRKNSALISTGAPLASRSSEGNVTRSDGGSADAAVATAAALTTSQRRPFMHTRLQDARPCVVLQRVVGRNADEQRKAEPVVVQER